MLTPDLRQQKNNLEIKGETFGTLTQNGRIQEIRSSVIFVSLGRTKLNRVPEANAHWLDMRRSN